LLQFKSNASLKLSQGYGSVMTVWFESAANSSSTKRTVRKFETAAILTSSGEMNEEEEETEKNHII